MEFTRTHRLEDGTWERRFTLPAAGGAVPGVLWTAHEAGTGEPLVLLGHGGGGSKDAPSMAARREGLVRDRGLAVVCIDAPGHGERGGIASLTEPAWATLWSRPEAVLDQMTADWIATLDAVAALEEFQPRAIGYYGVSLGTVFGLPLLAAEPRILAGALGLCGTRRTPGVVPAADDERRAERICAAARRVQCPVLFHVQWDDELFDRDGAFELYAMIGAADKRLQSTPGAHGGTTPEATDTMLTFLDRRLRAIVAASA